MYILLLEKYLVPPVRSSLSEVAQPIAFDFHALPVSVCLRACAASTRRNAAVVSVPGIHRNVQNSSHAISEIVENDRFPCTCLNLIIYYAERNYLCFVALRRRAVGGVSTHIVQDLLKLSFIRAQKCVK